MLYAFSSKRVNSFAPRQIDAGDVRWRQVGGNVAAAAVGVQDRFAAVTRGIEVVIQEGAGCEEGKLVLLFFVLFLQTLSTLRNNIFAYVSYFGGVVGGKFGGAPPPHVLDALDNCLVENANLSAM